MHHQARPLMFTNWPPQKSPVRNTLMVQLRQNSNRSPSAMFLKSGSSPHYSVLNSGRYAGAHRLKALPSMHHFLKSGPSTPYKRPFTQQFSAHSQKPVVTIKAAKPAYHFENHSPKNTDYVYEKVVPVSLSDYS